jgi:glycosyltransferase involved in cell wall biosynthesis/GT2 family glycosyltransferase
MTVSIIINTLNRDYWLKRVLDALMLQTYDDFEIIVVNGPSTDKTDEVLKAYKDIIKIEKCRVPNISISRNIGIKAAAGDIVIFIDDDAVPINKHWIAHYVKAFENDPELAGIGGKVYGSIFGENQFDKIMNVWGSDIIEYSTLDSNEYIEYEKKGYFKSFGGCNGAYLRQVLTDIGGYDEYYEYHRDETDLQARITRAGKKLDYHPYAHVYHEGARSANRNSFYMRDWFQTVKNSIYFAYKSSEGLFDLETRKINALNEPNNIKTMFKNWKRNREITTKEYDQIIDMWKKGVKQGEYDGLNSKRKLRYDLDGNTTFFKLNKKKAPHQLNVCFLIPTPIQNNGGSSKHTTELACGLFKLGVNVHIVYCGKENMDYMTDGINYYSISPSPLLLDKLEPYPICSNVLKLSYGAYKKVITLIEMFNIQIIETPLWDFNGLICAEFLNVPVVTRLQTPAKIVHKVHQYKETDDNLLFYEFEKRLMEKSSGIIAISDCITNTITDTYNIEFANKLYKNYLGIDDIMFETVDRKNEKIRVFFIGRLERRKGIANLFEVIPNILAKHKNVEFRLAGADVKDNILRTTFKDYFRHKYKHLLKNVSFLGEISNEQKEQELGFCDIFVSPSHYESFGIIFVEAMRHKKPVIGCNTGGMPEVVVHSVTGLLCKPDNSHDLEKTLLTLIEDKNVRESMGQKGYERFKEMFTRERMAQGTLEIYKKVIENYNKEQM